MLKRRSKSSPIQMQCIVSSSLLKDALNRFLLPLWAHVVLAVDLLAMHRTFFNPLFPLTSPDSTLVCLSTESILRSVMSNETLLQPSPQFPSKPRMGSETIDLLLLVSQIAMMLPFLLNVLYIWKDCELEMCRSKFPRPKSQQNHPKKVALSYVVFLRLHWVNKLKCSGAALGVPCDV